MSEDAIKRVEALLFAVGRAISVQELAELAKEPLSDIKQALAELKQQYISRESPLLIIEEGDAWKLTVHEKYMSVVQQINPHTELSKAVLETLAVVAWKQPATQSEVIKIRTNKAYEHIDELERLGFVAKEKYGRSYLLKVTQKFSDYFDLQGNNSIKQIFKDVKEVGEAQVKLDGLEPYGEREEVALEKEGKEHVGDLEVFADVASDSETTDDSDSSEENPVASFVAENKSNPAPQEVENDFAESSEEKSEEKEQKENNSEEEPVEERELDPALESAIKDK